jgi:hypothetical protein
MNDIFSTAKAYSVESGATADEKKRKQSQSTSQDSSQSTSSLFAVNAVMFSAAKANSVVSGATADEQQSKVVAVNEPRLQSFELGAW